YFYLRLENPDWPPEGFPMPQLLMPALAALLVTGGGLAMFRAKKRIEQGDQLGLRVRLIVATLLTTVGVSIQIIDFERLPFDSLSHAYGSVFYVLGWFAIIVTAAGLVMAIMTIYWA